MTKRWLSLAAVAALAIGFIGCSDSSDSEKTISFAQTAVPTDDASKAQVLGSTTATVNGKDYNIGFHTIVRTGQEFTSGTFGQLIDHSGAKLKEADGSAMICTNGSGPDHTTLLTHGKTLYAVTQFECAIGGAYVTKLAQDENGNLSAVDTKAADFSNARGTYVNCAGMTTPWGTHLGTEEYEPQMATWDASIHGLPDSWHDGHLTSIAQYLGKNRATLSDDEVKNLGYYYGWIWELEITGDNMESSVTKHYAMGRAAWEQAYVLPDNRTAFMGDDGTNGAFYMFVADKAKDMSAGNLYMAKWNQTSDEGAGAADLTWINLGHATDGEIDAAIGSGVTFDDMFVQSAYNNGCASADFTAIREQSGARCVKLKSGSINGTAIATVASRLESRIYGAMLGGTTEFRKEEGVTFNAQDKKLYVAMSQVAKGMEDASSKDIVENNHIRLTQNSCGAVYQLDVKGGIKDTAGEKINSNYVAVNMSGLVAGASKDYTGTIYEGNSCDVESLANPDNLSFLDGYGTLIIGEDTDSHPNDFIWSYDIKTGKLTRILTAPYGAETTSPFWHKNFGGYGYITTVIQHPFGEIGSSDPDYHIGANASDSDKESYIGYVGPLPKL